MKFEAAHLQTLANATGFPPDNLEKILRLRELLTEFHKHSFLRDRIVLKPQALFRLVLLLQGVEPRAQVLRDSLVGYGSRFNLPSSTSSRRPRAPRLSPASPSRRKVSSSIMTGRIKE